MKTYLKEVTCEDYYGLSARLDQLCTNFYIVLESIEEETEAVYKSLSEAGRKYEIESIKQALPALRVILNNMYDITEDCIKAEELQY